MGASLMSTSRDEQLDAGGYGMLGVDAAVFFTLLCKPEGHPSDVSVVSVMTAASIGHPHSSRWAEPRARNLSLLMVEQLHKPSLVIQALFWEEWSF